MDNINKKLTKTFCHSKPTLGVEEEKAILEVLKSGMLSQGPKVVEFENLVKNFIKRKYAIAVSSGLASLHLSLLSLSITQRDEVILPSYTCDALLQAVLYTGAKPIIVDVNYEDGNISFDSCLKVFSTRVKAIIIPHMFGFPAQIANFMNLGIPIVEDCAVAIGGNYLGKKLGSFGEVSIFSFYSTKMIATSEGGMCLTDDKKIADEIIDLRDYTKHSTFKIRYNYKMTDIEAALGIAQMKKLSQFINQRKILFDEYIKILCKNKNILLPVYTYNNINNPTFYRFIVKLNNYNVAEVIERMNERGITCGRGVLKPLHRLLNLDRKKYPNTEKLFKEVISLPIYPSLSVEDVRYIARNLLEVLNEI